MSDMPSLDPIQKSPMKISLIAAVGRNGVIGIKGKLPVRLPADLRRFRIMTSNKPVIMGRKTHDSIGKCLKSRTNIVLSHNENYIPYEGAILVNKLTEAYDVAYDSGADHTYVIGGAEIYKHFLPVANRICLTVIDEDLEGDTFFPIPVKAMLKWKGSMINAAPHSPINVLPHRFYILQIPDIDEIASYYECPAFGA